MTVNLVRKIFVVMLIAVVSACARAPEPLQRSEVNRELQSDLDQLGVIVDPLDSPVTLYQAIARAILYNREYKLSAMEAALSQRQYDLAKTNILPALTVSAGYSARDKYAASASTTFTNDDPDPLPASQPIAFRKIRTVPRPMRHLPGTY